MERFNKWYRRVLINDFVYKQLPRNSHQIPKLKKITLKSSFNSITDNSKNIVFNYVILKVLANQKPKICLATKSISAFKLQKKTPIACKVTLRKIKKDVLLNLLVNIVLPRKQSFTALNVKENGTLNVGIEQLSLFPQLGHKFEQIPRNLGLTISFDNSTINSNYFQLLLTGYQLPTE